MEAWRLKMEPWRVYRPVVADSQPFGEDMDLEGCGSPQWMHGGSNGALIEQWLQIPITLMRIRIWRAVEAHNGGLEAQNGAL